jgi:hypothetical protein
MVPLPRDEYIGQVDYWQSFVILPSIHFSSPNYHLTPMAESDNPFLPLQRPPFGNPATHKAHPLMFQAEYDIRFRHPAYEDPYDIFIVLPGLDHPEGGIHHQTALLACAVIANNSFSGWLTEDRDGKMRVNVPLDGILRAQDYYFQVSNDHRGE